MEFSNLINYSKNMCWSWPFSMLLGQLCTSSLFPGPPEQNRSVRLGGAGNPTGLRFVGLEYIVWNPGWALSTIVCRYCNLGICKQWEFVTSRPMTIIRESKLYCTSKKKKVVNFVNIKKECLGNTLKVPPVFFFWHYFLTNKLGNFRNFFVFQV
jgi:hypothetical protein